MMGWRHRLRRCWVYNFSRSQKGLTLGRKSFAGNGHEKIALRRADGLACTSILLSVNKRNLLKMPTKNKPPATPQSQEKPAETTPKPEATPEQKPAIREASGDKDKDKDKEEHFDMTEVAPVVTHHQITVDGKALKYTATAGRLPIKRGDGKIEAEMFYVAYTRMVRTRRNVR